jgi:signal transduction histidine kinase
MVLMNIRKKIGLFMSVISLTLVLFVGLFSVIISRDTVKDRGVDFIDTILNRTSYDIDLQISAMSKSTKFIYDSFYITFNYERGRTDQEYLTTYLERFEGTVQLAAELSPSKSAFLIIRIGDEEYVLWYQDGNGDGIPERYENPNTSRFNTVESTNETVWLQGRSVDEIASVRMLSNTGVKVIMGVDLDYFEIKNYLDTSKYLESGQLVLADEDLNVIYSPSGDYSTMNYEMTEAVKETQDANGIPIVVGSRRLSNDWELFITAETADIFSGLDRLYYIILTILLVAVVAALIYAIIISKWIADPYLYLTNKVEEIGKGNYSIQFDQRYLNREDEVGNFTKALRTTVKRQRDSFEEINNYNQNLEKIIEERTKELVKTNVALEESVITTEEKQEKLEVTNRQLEDSINEIKTTRKQLIRSEKIASSRFFAIGMAHNLYTPLGSAKSIASFIENRTEKIIDKFDQGIMSKRHLNEFLIETKSGSGKILESIEDSIQLIEKMKSLSIIDYSENISLVNVEEVIKLQVENSKKEHAQMVCGFTILVDASLKFKCDLYNLQKILYELINNSFTHAFYDDFSNGEPHITIKAYHNDVEDHGIILEYSDNGKGVEKEHRHELFTPLYTTKMSSKDGLGLTMVHNLVNERFHGDITVGRSQGNGLSFYIKLFEPRPKEVDYVKQS